MDSQSVKQKSEATKLHERFSEMRDQLVDAKARQTELIQSHERLQTTWCNATTGLALKHTKDTDCLSETHLECHTATSRKRREQLSQFVREHEELQTLVNGGCKAWEERLHAQMSNAKGKIELSSKLGKDVVDEATAASNQQLQEMQTYMKKRKINARTGFTPIKKDDRPFPSFQSTNSPAMASDAATNSPVSIGSPSPSEPGRKRQRTSDDSPSGFDHVTRSAATCAMPFPRNASVSTKTSQSAAGIPTSPSNQDALDTSKTSVVACVDARGTSVTSGFTDAKSVATPSKLKKAGVSGMYNKKSSGVAVTNRSMKVPSAGATSRKTTAASSIAAPKRYRAKSPRGDPSSHGR